MPQPGSTTRLDSQGDKIMHSVVYRNTTAAVHYAFDGFMAPLANPSAVNTMTTGATVPVTFSLAGDQGLGVAGSRLPRTAAGALRHQ